MGFEGSLDSVSFADILNTLCRLNREGVLIVSDDKRKKAIYFCDNGVTLIGGSQRVKLGDMLIRAGKIQARELEIALNEQSRTGKLLGEIFVNQGIISAEEIEEIIANQIQEEICDLFFWENAHFSFNEGPPSEEFKADPSQVTLSFDVQSVLFKIADQMNEWEEIRRQLPSFSIIFVCSSEGKEIEIPETETQENFEKIFRYLDGTNDINDIIRLSQIPVLTVCRILILSLQQGAIAPAKYEELIQTADEYQKKGQAQKQIRFLEQAFLLRPNDDQLLLKLAQIYETIGGGKKAGHYYCKLGELSFIADPKMSAKYFERAITYIPKSATPRENLLALAENLEDQEKEMAHGQALALIYREEGSYSKAIELCHSFLDRYPENVEFRNVLAEVYLEQKEHEKVIQQYESLAVLYEQKGNTKAYLETLERIVEEAPDRLDIQKRINKIRRKIRWEKHRTLVISGIVVLLLLLVSIAYALYYEVSARSIYSRGKLFEERSNYEDAQKLYDTLLNRYPLSSMVEKTQLALQQIKGRLEKEKKIREEQIQERKKNILGRFETIQHYARQDQFEKAWQELNRCRKEYPEPEWQKIAQETEQALVEREAKFQEAKMKEDFKRAQEYQKQGKFEEAEKIYHQWGSAKFKDLIKQGNIDSELQKINLQKLQELVRVTKEVFENGLQNEKIGNFRGATSLYEQVEANANKAIQIKGINESQERELSHIMQLAEQGRNRIREFEREAGLKLQLAQNMLNEKKIEEAFAEILKVIDHGKLGKTEAASKAYLPILITSKPSGAQIRETSYKTPFTYAFQPRTEEDVKLTLIYPGFISQTISVDRKTTPIVNVTLAKQNHWNHDIQGSISGKIALSRNKMVVTSHTGKIVALNPDTGSVHWRQKTSTNWGDISAGPVIFGEKVYIGSHDQFLYCFDLETGRMDWKFKCDGFIKVLPSVDSANLFFGTTNGYFYALNRMTGTQIWEYKSRSAIESSSVFCDNSIIFGNSRGHLTALNLMTGNQEWILDFKSPILANLVMGGKHVFFGTMAGGMHCFNAETKELVWQKQLQGGVEGSVAIYGTYLYVVTTEGCVYKFSRLKGALSWKTKLPKAIYCSPLKVEELLYVGCMDSFLYALDIKTGEIFWEGQYGTRGIRSDLAVYNDKIYVSTENGVLYALAK